MRLAILTSGKGGNAHYILKACQIGALPEVHSVHVLHGVRFIYRQRSPGAVSTTFIEGDWENQESLRHQLDLIMPDLILLNYDHLIPGYLIDLFPGKFVNLHYSLLPTFKGMWLSQISNTLNRDRPFFSGVTLHDVNEHVDAGPIRLQALFTIRDDHNENSIAMATFKAGVLVTIAFLSSFRDAQEQDISFEKVSFAGQEFVLLGKKYSVPLNLLGSRFFEELPG